MSWKPVPMPFAKFKKEVFKKSARVANFIYQIGEYPDLRKPSSEVSVKNITSEEMRKKIAYLKKCLVAYRKKTGYGRGISAVQIGILERFAVVFYNTVKVAFVIAKMDIPNFVMI